MNHQKISFAIKATNWCNLCCTHCCESSGPNIAPNIMPLNKVEKYIGEFNAMPLPKWEYIVFTGGETMAPYYHGQPEYMPHCLDIVASHKMAPFVKTNGLWGAQSELRNHILHDFATAAYKNNMLMSMDISVDAFHKNADAVFNILRDIVHSDYLASAVRISLASLNDTKSRIEFSNLIDALRANGMTVQVQRNGMFTISVPNIRTVSVYYDLWTNISNVGRAMENNLGKFIPDGRPDMETGHCLQIDNYDIAKLNYKHTTPVNNRPVYDIAKELLSKVR